MIFYANLFILIGAAFFTEVVSIDWLKKSKKYIFWILSGYLFLFAATRVDTGYDFESYKNIFYDISKTSFMGLFEKGFFSWLEPGYVLLNYILKFLPFQLFLFIVTAIAMFPKIIFIRKKCDKYIITLLFYYCTIMLGFDMGVIRQAIATGICFWALYALYENKKKKYVFLVFLACMFHYVSLILFLCAFVKCNKKYENKFYFLLIILALLLSKVHLLTTILGLIPGFGGYLYYKISVYAFHRHDANDTEISIYISVVKRLIVFIPMLFVVQWKKLKNSHYIVYLNSLFLSIIVSLVFVDMPIISGRGTGVLQSTQLLLLPLLLNVKYVKTKPLRTGDRIFLRICYFSFAFIIMGYSLYSTLCAESYTEYHNYLFESLF